MKLEYEISLIIERTDSVIMADNGQLSFDLLKSNLHLVLAS